MRKFFYIFMASILTLLVIYWFVDGRPTNEGYAWLFGGWAGVTVIGYAIDRWQARKSNLNKRP